MCRQFHTGAVSTLTTTRPWGSDSDNCIVYVFEMDLDISGVSDEDEEDPGGFICVNDDDDNGEGTPDKDETGTVSGEDDLVAISLSYLPSNLYPGFVELKIPYSDDDIKVWSSSEKGTLVIPDGSNYYKRWQLGTQPSTLYVEGCSAGTADLWLLYTPDGQEYPGGDSGTLYFKGVEQHSATTSKQEVIYRQPSLCPHCK